MRASIRALALLGLALGLVPAGPALSEPVSPAEAWRPVRVFIGSWTGNTGTAKEKVTRQFASSNDNRRLVVLERNGEDVASWGEIAYDADLHNLVLLPREGAPELVLQRFETPNLPERLVFESAPDGSRAARLTYEFKDWNEFVERLEERGSDGRYTVTRETRFKRGNTKLALKPSADAPERTAGR